MSPQNVHSAVPSPGVDFLSQNGAGSTLPSPRRLVEYTHYFLDNNVLVSLSRNDALTEEWASKLQGRLYCTEIAQEEHLNCGRTALPPQVQLVNSEVDSGAQERAIKRILQALNLNGNSAEKLKPDLRYLIQSSWACWDVDLGIPYDAKVAFITFDMKFWRRLLQHDEKLRLIETMINDEGLDHLIDVACAQEYIGREPVPSPVPLPALLGQPQSPLELIRGTELEAVLLSPAPSVPSSSMEPPDTADVEPGAGVK